MNPEPMNAKLEHYLAAWQLSDPEPLARTPTSHLYTVRRKSDTVVLKLLTDYGWEEQRGASALRYFNGHGAVRLYRSDAAAHLVEYADGEELVSWSLKIHDSDAAQWALNVAKLLEPHCG
jgi:streptomycin 6-kinase